MGRVHRRTAPFPRQPAAGGDGAERDHDNRPGLAVCQVGGDGAAEEFVHADPQAAAAAADDDHLCAEDVGSRPRGVADVTGQFSQLHQHLLFAGQLLDPIG